LWAEQELVANPKEIAKASATVALRRWSDFVTADSGSGEVAAAAEVVQWRSP
jgi:hypothetical protein